MALLLSAAACTATSDHFMTMSMGCGAINSCASSRAFVDAFSKMHQAMALNFTCNANVDFVHGMIAHHEGEVAMCDALLNSDAVVDTELRALCGDLTRQQNDEVQLLEAWLLTQGHPSHASGHNHWCDHQPPPRCVILGDSLTERLRAGDSPSSQTPRQLQGEFAAAMGGAFRSMDDGHTWQRFY